MPALLFLTLLLVTGTEANAQTSFNDEVMPILTRRCAMCHLPGAAQAELELYPDAWASIVGIPSIQSTLALVEAGDPEQSYLYLKLIGTHESAGGSGALMPFQQGSLDPGQLNTFRSWIEQGAVNN